VRPDEIKEQKQQPVAFDATADGDGLELDQPVALPNPNLPLIGKVVGGKYEVLELLGEGGMSAVFLCRHQSLDQLMAIKILHYDRSMSQNSLKRFRQEAKATYQLNHPNLIRLVDFGTAQENVPYLVMEYVAGKTLADLLIEHGRLGIEQFVDIFTQICDGLSYAHSRGIVHRDLKPSNIMLTKGADGTEQVKIVDFGIAKMALLEKEQQLTGTGDVFGSPPYMSPEQCRGLIPDNRSDLYSLGCVMFEALTGSAPFRGDNPMQTMFMHVEQPVPALKSLTTQSPEALSALEEIVSRLLKKNPAERFQSALDVKKELSACLSPSQSSTAARRGSRIAWVLLPAMLLIFASAMVFNFCFVKHTNSLSEKSTGDQKANVETSPESSPVAEVPDTSQKEVLDAAQQQLEPTAAQFKVRSIVEQAVKSQKSGQIKQAKLLYEQALQLADSKINKHSADTRQVLISYCFLLFSEGDRREYKRLAAMLERTEKLLNVPPAVLSIHQSNIYGWHGVTLARLSKYAEALQSFEKAESAATEGGVVGQRVTWLFWQGHTLFKQGKLEEAMRFYDRAERLAGDQHPLELCETLYNKADNLWEAGRHKEARMTLQRAKNIADRAGFTSSNPGEAIKLANAMESFGMIHASDTKSEAQ